VDTVSSPTSLPGLLELVHERCVSNMETEKKKTRSRAFSNWPDASPCSFDRYRS
jgi:hypothetical protein